MRYHEGMGEDNRKSFLRKGKICAGTVITVICSIMRYVNPREDENTHPFTAYQGCVSFRIEL